MSLLRQSLVAGCICEFVAVMFGVLASTPLGSDGLDSIIGKICEWIYYPGIILAKRLFPATERGVALRLLFMFGVQWLVYTAIALGILLVVSRKKRQHEG